MKSTSSALYGCGLVFSLIAVMAGCGSSNTSHPTPANTVTVALNQTSATINADATEQFQATVQGTTNTAVTWSVDGVSGGNSAVGTINASGLYTAPSLAGSHSVTATSVADSTKSASATVTIMALKALTITVNPASATVMAGSTERFSATVLGGSNEPVTWSLAAGSGGTISASGLYTAPATPGSYTVMASTTGGASASATVGVFTFTISYPSSSIAPSADEQFTATIGNLANTAVTWSVDGVAGGNTTTGTISATGLYTAPFALGSHTITATSAAVPSASVSAGLTINNSAPAAVLTYHNDDARDGAFLEERTLTPSNVKSTQFGKLAAYPVDGQVYAQPLYMPQIAIPSVGMRDVVFVETQNNSVYAFDADATSTATEQTFWHVNLGAPVTKNDYSGVNPVVGILSTPVIDATTNTMYVFAESSNASGPFHLHALDVTTGKEKFGGPVAVTGSVPGTGLDSSGGVIALEPDCYQRMGLGLNPVTNLIYIAFGSCNHGWVLTYNKTTLQPVAIFNDTPDGGGGGLWSSGGAPAIDDATGNVYLMSGVDAGDPVTNGYNDSFLYLNPATLAVESFFSPDDNEALAAADADLGSGSNVLMPDNASSTPHETIGGGKDGNIFVVNRDDMGGYLPPPVDENNVIQTVLTGTGGTNNIFSTPVYWNGSIYFHCSHDVLRAFSWDANTGLISTTATSVGSTAYTMHGATASLSADGNTNAIIWDIDNSLYNGTTPSSSGSLVLHAYDATNVATELYNSSQAAGGRDTAGLALKFTVPTITGGKVYVPTANELDIYGLLP